MKYVVILGDGMADYPLEAYDNKTPLELAHKPNIDSLAKNSVLGMVQTVPESMKPGSDVANLGALGYDAKLCYTGRSPLEAVSMGICLLDTDVAFRCNLVTLSDDTVYSQKTMLDYSSGEITTQEAKELIETIQKELSTEQIKFFSGISYRHCMVWNHGPVGLNLTPPHDISDRKITQYLPENNTLLSLMNKSYEILKSHPVNLARIKRGLNPANSIWLWGEGTKPAIENFEEIFGVKGSVISAVDLIKGIGICAGMKVVEVEGATGNLDTNFEGKAAAAIEELKRGQDFVYLHIEAPDECGHHGDISGKIQSIEWIDEKIVGPILKELQKSGEEFSILVLPDHPTPIVTKTHASDPVPFLLYRSSDESPSGFMQYNEKNCCKTGLFLKEGPQLMKLFLQK